MRKKFFSTIPSVFLIIAFTASSTFFIAPTAHANFVVVPAVPNSTTADWSWTNLLDLTENTISAIADPITAAATVAKQVNDYVLQPLAFVMSGNLMKSLTASVIKFVTGKTNGKGSPQFVLSVRKNTQGAGDKSALAFFAQFNSNSNSPFAASIRSSLTTNYLQNTSLAGFWGANQNTLGKASPNQNAFLSGRYSQGGVAAWFSLTTQPQNNPYVMYQRSQAQLASLVDSTVQARLSELSWGGGFLSWCGVSDAATQTQSSASGDLQTCMADCDAQPGGYTAACADACNASFTSAGGTAGGSTAAGTNPGDSCTNSDGTPGTIQTPGSTIKATLDKVLGGSQDKLAAIGNIGAQIGQLMGSIGTILNTVSFAQQILGGGSGGLLTVGGGSAAGSQSRLAAFAPFQNPSSITSASYMGASTTGVYQSAASLPSSGSDKIKLVDMYEHAWTVKQDAATAASACVSGLASFCSAAVVTANGMSPANSCEASQKTAFITKATATAAAAGQALGTVINPVLTQASNVPAIVCAAKAMVAKVQCELTAINAPGSAARCELPNFSQTPCDPANPGTFTDAATNVTAATYQEDLRTLLAMPPSTEEAVLADQESKIVTGATGVPPGSLTISSTPSTVAQMNLMCANANALKVSDCSFTDACVAGQSCGQNGVCLGSKFGNVCVPQGSSCLPPGGGGDGGGS